MCLEGGKTTVLAADICVSMSKFITLITVNKISAHIIGVSTQESGSCKKKKKGVYSKLVHNQWIVYLCSGNVCKRKKLFDIFGYTLACILTES